VNNQSSNIGTFRCFSAALIAAGACCLALWSATCAAQAGPAERLTVSALKNTSYSGIQDIGGPVRLQAGTWQGRPPMPGSASVPRVDFLGRLAARGDLTGDGIEEAAVLLASNFGGSGVFLHVAIVGQQGSGLRNLDTRFVGDRIQVRDLRIESGQVVLDVVRAGPNDPSCCPTEVVSLRMRMTGGHLGAAEQVGPASRLSLNTLSGPTWRLASWNDSEPAPDGLTLSYAGGQFQGTAACNGYSASVRAPSADQTLEVGLPRSTRKMCEQEQMVAEQRFLGLLTKVNRFWFDASRLALPYGQGSDAGVMLFERSDR
jgi:heat shock protein HslJ